MKRLLLSCFVVFAVCLLESRAQEPRDVLPGFLRTLKPRSIGPANMSGRIVDVAVYEKRPSIMYVASASGGLWKTVNNGITWDPVFERQTTVALGAVAVAQTNPAIVWAGSGEANARNSVSWGDGVYRSTDGGRTWKNMGLRDSHHIGRIVIHPADPNIVYVAALGHIWGPNRERGLYKTTDAGASWQQVKYINEDTGFVDLVMDPADPNVLYAAAYQVRRDAFSGGNPAVQCGPQAGLYKSSDGGQSWKRLTAGLPGRQFGRCGLSVYRKDPNVVYAVVQTDLTPTPTAGQSANLRAVTDKDENGKSIERQITPDYGGIFRSADKGETWTWVNSLCPRPFYYGQVRIDPHDDQRIYVLGVMFHLSTNGGKSFAKESAARGVHSDHHALWIDPHDSHHLVLGCDGGLYFSYDRSAHWEHLLNLPVGQFYAVGVDMRKPYRVYGGLQDNGSWGGPSATHDVAGITIADWFRIFGMDGYYCQPDPDDLDTVYCEGQYGILNRVNVRTGKTTSIKPRLESQGRKGKGKGKGGKGGKGGRFGGKPLASNIVPAPPKGTPEFRFNWCAPILLSPHNSRTVYFGGNHVFRSDDRGDHWAIASPDLTRGKPGPSVHTGHTITTLAESPLKAGLLYSGSDDGRIHITGDGGKQWLDLSGKLPLPPQRWITRVECSHFQPGTAYLSADRHRHNDRTPYLFKTADYGNTWKAISGNLPAGGPVHVIREDPKKQDLLYAGTEFGLFISADAGQTWHKQTHLPTVPVHDLVVHPRDRELVIGTHGRSIYVMDVAPLQDLTRSVLDAAVHVFEIKPARAYRPRSLHSIGSKNYAGENPPYGAGIYYHLKEASAAAPTVTVTDDGGKKVAELKGNRQPGLHRISWKLGPLANPKAAYPIRTVPAGEYTVTLRVDDTTIKKSVRVEVED